MRDEFIVKNQPRPERSSNNVMRELGELRQQVYQLASRVEELERLQNGAGSEYGQETNNQL